MKQLILFLAGLVAPIVTLFYRKSIWLTPDDSVSLYGQYEPRMVWIYSKFGKFIGDWWWLGFRNTAYGLAYKWKIQALKDKEGSFYTDEMEYVQQGNKRVISLGEFKETTRFFKFFHVIYGYRLRPVWDTMNALLPVQKFNMDGRPILSIRFGNKDD